MPKLRPNKGPKSRPKTIAKIRKEMDVLRRLQVPTIVLEVRPVRLGMVQESCI